MTLNLEKAIALVEQIDRLRAVQRELKSGFARDQLDGGAKTAMTHPLFLEAQAAIVAAQDELKHLI